MLNALEKSKRQFICPLRCTMPILFRFANVRDLIVFYAYMLSCTGFTPINWHRTDFLHHQLLHTRLSVFRRATVPKEALKRFKSRHCDLAIQESGRASNGDVPFVLLDRVPPTNEIQ